MAKIKVELEAFYGYSCGFRSHGSNETVELEVSDNELDALKKLGKEQVTAEDVVAAIESGDTTLNSLHEQLSEKFYYMVEEYWLYEADNECLEECLSEAMGNDIDSGEYIPDIELEEFVAQMKAGDIDFEGLQFGYFNDIDEDFDYDDEDELQYKYDGYILNAYYDWVQEHDHAFVAERVGLGLYACREDEVNYVITL